MNISPVIEAFLKKALHEDIGKGDITTLAVVPKEHLSLASLTARESFVLAGLPFTEKIFKLVDKRLRFIKSKSDGERIKKGALIVQVKGRTRSLLTAERTALNLLQRMSGIATLTDRYIKCLKGLPVKITDTRKTTPGLRFFEKYSVRVGGGYNHRFGLFDAILIKDNHIIAAGDIKKAVKLARGNTSNFHKIEVETKNITEIKEALDTGVDTIMLDNMSVKQIRRAVEIIRNYNPDVIIEASGNMKLDNIRSVAEAGVDMISVGALTHSAGGVDISMNIRNL